MLAIIMRFVCTEIFCPLCSLSLPLSLHRIPHRWKTGPPMENRMRWYECASQSRFRLWGLHPSSPHAEQCHS